MITRGTVFHHKSLVFHNGFTGKKYLVLLNSPDKNEDFLFVKTTSQKKNKPTTPGSKEAVKKTRVALEQKTEKDFRDFARSKQNVREQAHQKYLD